MEGQSIVRVDAERASGVVVLSPEGDVDMSRSPELRNAIRAVLNQQRPKKLVIDLGDVAYMDSSGLATLVEAMRTTRTAGVRMILCAMNEKVRAVFEIARLDQYFNIENTIEEAIDA